MNVQTAQTMEKINDYSHPETLVETSWVEAHLNDVMLRLVEVDVEPKTYAEGHIPGAVGWNWKTDTQDTLRRDLPSKEAMEGILSRAGIKPDTTIILYGDSNNWFAAYALWLLKYYDHKD